LSAYAPSGSAYDIGEIDLTSPTSLLTTFPRAVWLGLFRPHPWETRGSPVMALSALESFFLLFLTLRIFLTVKLLRIFNLFFEQPFLLFCLVFALFVAFSLALTSGNFGSLVRYRIPLFPFYLAMLYILRFYANKSTKLF
jgi:hypothetical protein